MNWFNSCIDSLFADVTLTLHKSQVHCALVSRSDELAVDSCPLFFLEKQVVKLANILFCGWSLLRNNSWQQIFKIVVQVTVVSS